MFSVCEVWFYAHAADGAVAAEDSDYFTPEEPSLAPHDVITSVAGECTPQRWALPHRVTSLPGTPLSQASVRSSGDSYSSTSSTRQLLVGAPLAADPAC
ncbi:unnamed protein product [Euphydryas editha]|uniref:Uncharacterized protein n=1 Tax=Euphydryas editha TaxID=104508 RepID=A0AAU9TQM0_EUPED|nr:unnamed protein product [Euphydryas editha]